MPFSKDNIMVIFRTVSRISLREEATAKRCPEVKGPGGQGPKVPYQNPKSLRIWFTIF